MDKVIRLVTGYNKRCMTLTMTEIRGLRMFPLLFVMAVGGACYGQTPAEWTEAHNKYRRNLETYDKKPTASPDLVWSEALAKDAKEWAEKMSASGEMKHRPNSSKSTSADARAWGENLAWGSSAPYSYLEGIAAWYNEKPFFKPATSNCTPGNVCGHFTQVVSQLSREVGCGMATGANGVYVVCNYNPHGNDVSGGQYAELYPNQMAPVPGGPSFGSLKSEAKLNLIFNECLKGVAEGLLAAAVPDSAGTPTDGAAACGFSKVRMHDTGVMSAYTGAPATAAGVFINYVFGGKVLGTNGAVAVSVKNPARAVLVTGE